GGRDALSVAAARHYGTTLTIKLDAGSFDDVCVLPQSRIAGIRGDARIAMRHHGSRGDVDWVRGRQQGAIRLRLQLAAGAFDLAFGDSGARLTIHPHGA